MKRLERIRVAMLKDKAAKLLEVKAKAIISVTEHHGGAGVALKNGNILQIPYEVWVLGMTEAEYIALRNAK